MAEELKDSNYNYDYGYSWHIWAGNWGAFKFTAGSSYEIGDVSIMIQPEGATGAITMKLRADNGGVPGSLLATAVLSGGAPGGMNWNKFSFDPGSRLSAVSGTTYWICVKPANSVWLIIGGPGASVGDYYSADETSWSYSYWGSGCYEIYTDAAAGWANIAKGGGVASADMAKFLGIAVADCAKISGASV